MRKLLALLCCLVVFVACGGDDGDDVPADVANAPSKVTGVIVDVQSEGLEEVTGFTLKDGDAEYEILIDENVDYGFALGHLREHLRTGDPVSVPLDLDGGKLYALSIDDA